MVKYDEVALYRGQAEENMVPISFCKAKTRSFVSWLCDRGLFNS